MIKAVKSRVSRVNLILLLILLLAFLFRFYKLIDWFQFGMDQEYEIFLVKNIVSMKHIPLIGVNASDTGIYLGPFFIYFAVIPYVIFAGNPVGLAVTASLLGLLTTYLIYYLVKKMFSLRAAFFSSFFYATSFLASFYDRTFWNPSLVPLLSLFIGYFIYEINKNNYKYFIYLAVVFGLAFHSHLSLLIFAPLIIWIILKHFKQVRKKILIMSLVVFLAMQLPQIIFEFRHNFTNTKATLSLISGLGKNDRLESTLYERTGTFINYLGRFFWVPPAPDLFVEKNICRELSGFQKNPYPEAIGIIFIVLCYFFYCHINKRFSKDKPDAYKIIISILLLSTLSIFFYNGTFSEYYFLFLMPYLAIILGVSAGILSQNSKMIFFVYALLSIFFGMNLITLLTAKTSYSHSQKMAVIDFSRKNIGSSRYSLEALGDCPRFAGWRYLFEYHLRIPESSYMDSYFGWLYNDSAKTQPEKIVLLSMIDPRSKNESIVRWQEEKISYLNKYNIINEAMIDKIHVLILAPKK